MADVTMTHPAHRAVHAVNNARQMAYAIERCNSALDARSDAGDVRRLLEHVPADITALYQCNERLEEDLRGLRDQGLADAQEITELRREVARLSMALGEEQREREALVASITESLASLNEVHRQANRMRIDSARRDVPPAFSITHEPPRVAATGA
jgi:chromosome segregation ATPase